MISVIKLNQFKAHTPLLECLISLIFHVETEFTPYAPKFLPVLIEFVASNEWSTKKVAIDAIYSMTAMLKEEEKKKQASPSKAKPMFLDLLVNDEE